MARVEPLDLSLATVESREAFDNGIKKYGRMTNMKVTLLRSLPAFDALMAWYPLRDHLLGFMGPRAFDLFAHAISHATKCPVCTNYFRRVLIEAGENPSSPTLDEREQALVNFGRSIGFDPRHVADEVYEPLTRFFSQDQIVAIVAFAGMMVATNIVNNALRVEVDEYLQPYAEAR